MNAMKKLSNEIFEVIKLNVKAAGGEVSAEYEDATSIVEDVINSEVAGSLLFKFWQRSSDACPLGLTEAEDQETKFREWVKTLKTKDLYNF